MYAVALPAYSPSGNSTMVCIVTDSTLSGNSLYASGTVNTIYNNQVGGGAVYLNSGNVASVLNATFVRVLGSSNLAIVDNSVAAQSNENGGGFAYLVRFLLY